MNEFEKDKEAIKENQVWYSQLSREEKEIYKKIRTKIKPLRKR